MAHLMAQNRSTRLGAVRGATWVVSQALQRRRWAVLCHLRPVAFARQLRCALLVVPVPLRNTRLSGGQNQSGQMGHYQEPLV